MHTVDQLKNQKCTGDFLNKYLDHLFKYFSNNANLSEEKTYLRIKKISERIRSNFPFLYSIENISNRLAGYVKDKVDDKFEPESEISMNSLLQKLGGKQESQLGRKVDQAWLNKQVLDEIRNMKDDVKDCDEQVRQKLESKIPASGYILFMDSFLCNVGLVQEVCEKKKATLKIVNTGEQVKEKERYVDLKDASRHVKKADLVIISGESILKDGGILSNSGSLMVAISAHTAHIPVIALSRAYCLSDLTLAGQQTLITYENPLKFFPNNDTTGNNVLIGKTYDYIEGKLITQIIIDIGIWSPQNSYHMFSTYYD